VDATVPDAKGHAQILRIWDLEKSFMQLSNERTQLSGFQNVVGEKKREGRVLPRPVSPVPRFATGWWNPSTRPVLLSTRWPPRMSAGAATELRVGWTRLA
jgi:hypothetical protein